MHVIAGIVIKFKIIIAEFFAVNWEHSKKQGWLSVTCRYCNKHLHLELEIKGILYRIFACLIPNLYPYSYVLICLLLCNLASYLISQCLFPSIKLAENFLASKLCI